MDGDEFGVIYYGYDESPDTYGYFHRFDDAEFLDLGSPLELSESVTLLTFWLGAEAFNWQPPDVEA